MKIPPPPSFFLSVIFLPNFPSLASTYIVPFSVSPVPRECPYLLTFCGYWWRMETFFLFCSPPLVPPPSSLPCLVMPPDYMGTDPTPSTIFGMKPPRQNWEHSSPFFKAPTLILLACFSDFLSALQKTSPPPSWSFRHCFSSLGIQQDNTFPPFFCPS